MVLTLIITFSLLGSVVSILVAALFLLFPENIRIVFIPAVISYATGTLLGAAFLGLIPTAAESITVYRVSVTLLAGLVGFFILEKLIIWRHCHNADCKVHKTAGSLILIGDAFHNFVDGVIIAASFIVSIPLGIMTSLSVITHEIPQEVGDFAILLDAGYSRLKAFGLNMISGLTAFVGALLSYLFMQSVRTAVPYVMCISAASFIYIAIGDLIPGLNHHTRLKDSFLQISLLLAGIGTILIFNNTHT